MDDNKENSSNPPETDPSGRFIQCAELLGFGAAKTVYKAIDRDKGIEVAWNQMKLDRSTVDFKKLYGEVEILKSLEHPAIIEFYHAWVDEKKAQLVFITECMTSGNLKQFIRKARSVKLKVIKGWCIQILEGLKYLHTRSPPIIHRDIKCDNIFINGSLGQLKIGDLGLATVKRRNGAYSVIGTPEFMAPEFYEERYNEKVDIWAFGLCVLEMATLEYPYGECENAAQVFKKVSTGQKPDALHKIKDAEIREFIELCLQSDPDKRPSAVELLNHPFLSDLSDEKYNRPTELSGDADLSSRLLPSTGEFIIPHSDTIDIKVATIPKGNITSPFDEPQFFEIKPVEAIKDHILEVNEKTTKGDSLTTPLNTPIGTPSHTPLGTPSSTPMGTPQVERAKSETQKPPDSPVVKDPTKVEPKPNRVDVTLVDKPEAGDVVQCKLKLHLADGWQDLLFDFNLSKDTAEQIASEMGKEFSLSPEFQEDIASCMRKEVNALLEKRKPRPKLAEIMQSKSATSSPNVMDYPKPNSLGEPMSKAALEHLREESHLEDDLNEEQNGVNDEEELSELKRKHEKQKSEREELLNKAKNALRLKYEQELKNLNDEHQKETTALTAQQAHELEELTKKIETRRELREQSAKARAIAIQRKVGPAKPPNKSLHEMAIKSIENFTVDSKKQSSPSTPYYGPVPGTPLGGSPLVTSAEPGNPLPGMPLTTASPAGPAWRSTEALLGHKS